ncbi:hypothetical protein EIP91_010610 [Steccherinum ochraceum]|uniref:Uncharacterized protein n=1 Tax=Steccherinum ochraceum TaxID=92696 RepID=A0A4R0R5P7_9APHY|nr:hypothetical protein EIP91_010610 [Steccherinum ochraceum]
MGHREKQSGGSATTPRHTTLLPAMFLALEKQRSLERSSAEKVLSSSDFPVPREASAVAQVGELDRIALPEEATSLAPPRGHCPNASDKARTLLGTSLHPVPGLLERVFGTRGASFDRPTPEKFPPAVVPADVFQDSWNRPAPLSPEDLEEPTRLALAK